MFHIRKPNLTISLEDYKEALFTSLLNEDWVGQAYTNEYNMMDWLAGTNPIIAKKAIKEYKKTKDIASLIRAKNQVCFTEQALEMIFEAGKAKTNMKLAEIIYHKTSFYANITKNLLVEYCQNTADHLEAVITPYPRNIEETTRPIGMFQIKTSNSNILHVELSDKCLKVISENEKYKNYFEKRKKSKEIKKAFLKSEQITQETYKKAVRDLINLKETEIPTNKCYSSFENCEYKILYRSNQTVSDQYLERSLMGHNIKVLSITKIK